MQISLLKLKSRTDALSVSSTLRPQCRRLTLQSTFPPHSTWLRSLLSLSTSKAIPGLIGMPPCLIIRLLLTPYSRRVKLAETLCSYDLFSVVNHEGQMDTGHYTVFARSQDMVCSHFSFETGVGSDCSLHQWYKFDDDKVTPASLGEVLSSRSKAYMCFYMRKQLDYRSRAADLASRPTTNINVSLFLFVSDAPL